MAIGGANGRTGLGLRARLRAGVSHALGRLRSPAPDALGPPAVGFGGAAPAPVEAGQTLLAVAAAQQVELDSFCGGRARCGSCRVEIDVGRGALEPITAVEQMVLGAERARLGDRLACQARVRGTVAVRVPLRF